jgi:Group II intron, maturase-specific domain
VDPEVGAPDLPGPLASRKAVQHARDRIREITARERLLLWPELIVEDLNSFLRGWAGYFRYGNSALVLGQIRNYALERLALWLSKKGNRRRAWGWASNRCCCPRTIWA